MKFLGFLMEAKEDWFLNKMFTLEMSKNYSFRDEYKR